MPKTVIDYSNTVFYKIYCKDVNFHDVYIGHKTNFVQRKHAHKRACNKSTDKSHHLKVYKVIREHGGWENWTMEIIGFKNCKDHSEACTIEQEYFDSYKASLNSILAHKPTIKRIPVTVKDKLDLFCKVCNVNFTSRNQYEKHKNTKKHECLIRKQNNFETLVPENHSKYSCVKCNFFTNNKKDFNRHKLTAKHICRENDNKDTPKNPTIFKCECGLEYRYKSGLYRHRKNCKSITKTHIEADKNNENLIEIIIRQQESHKKESEELKMMILKQQELLKKQQEELDKQIQELMPKNADNKASKPKVK